MMNLLPDRLWAAEVQTGGRGINSAAGAKRHPPHEAFPYGEIKGDFGPRRDRQRRPEPGHPGLFWAAWGDGAVKCADREPQGSSALAGKVQIGDRMDRNLRVS